MNQKLKEIVDETKYVYSEYWRGFKQIRAVAEANRGMPPTHPRYLNQFKRDTGRGFVGFAFSTVLTLGVVGYAFGMESRSEQRAQNACFEMMCKENIILQDVQKGINPNADNRIRDRPSLKDVKKALDEYYWSDDRYWIRLGAGVSIPLNILTGLYLLNPMIKHRRKLAVFRQDKPETSV